VIRDPRPTPHARLIITTLVVVLSSLLFGIDRALAAQWTHPVEVDYNPANSNIPALEMESAIEYVVWSLSERTGLPIVYTGTTTAPGRISVVWSDLPWMVNGRFLRGRTTVNWIDGRITDAKVELSRAFFRDLGKCNIEILIHELTHALGYESAGESQPNDIYHPLDDHGVMWSGDHCRYSLSTDDVRGLPYGKNLCHVELTREFDLYLPDMRAEMIYSGVVGGYHTWTLNGYAPGLSQCARIENGRIVLTDIRTLGKRYSRAVLEPYNGKYRLVELTN